MEQFRQRVAASCHIGPLDRDETQRYIEHRLKKAGSKGKPSFDAAAFDAIHRVSGGIPRRINSVCDRLLLLGFLANKTALNADDVAEVAKEFEQESYVPPKPAAAAGAVAAGGVQAAADLDVDLTTLDLDPELAQNLQQQLAQLSAEQKLDQMQRLERSLLRLERLHVQTLALLKKLVDAAAKPRGEDKP
jgi:hypothetical protein